MTPKQERNQVIFGAAVLALFCAGLMWLVSTNQPPRIDHATPDAQTYLRQTYELKGAYKKYAQECYDGTHEKN